MEEREKTASAKLREEGLRLLVGSVREYAVFLLETDGAVASWNEGAQSIKGYAPGEIVGKSFAVFYPKDDRDAGKPERALRIAEAEGRFEEEGWRCRKDGSLFWASVVITALRDERGDLLGFGKVTRDLTEKRRVEENLRRSEERLRLLVLSVKDYAVYMLDREGRVATWNEGARRLKGYEESEIVGRHFSEFFTPEDRAAGKPERELRIAAQSGRFEDEAWRVRKDGKRFWANVVLAPIRDERGELIGFAKVTRDLTERRAGEQKLRDAMEELRRSNAELDQYAAFVSHDLQEPLRKMASFAELLERRHKDKLDAEGREFARLIVDGAQRMRALIVDLLDYSRIGRAETPAAKVDLNAVVRQAVSDLDLAVKDAGAEVLIGDLPRLAGNETRLARLFRNLLSNALKFRDPARRLRVEIKASREDKEVVISVADNGIGFEPSKAEQIMKPFVRLNPRDRYPGSGLGLASARKIAQLHGGRLWARSHPGQGSTFCVALPDHG